jgi:hypothetical protein
VFGLAVSSGPTIASTATLTSLNITPATPTITSSLLGQQQQFQVTGTYSDGTKAYLTTSATWSSSDTTVATIHNAQDGLAGLATTTGYGTATTTASYGGLNATATLTSTQPPLTSITVTPANSTLNAGTALQYTATGTYADNVSKDISASVTWTSSNPAAATISSTGLANALTTGSTTITATSGMVQGIASLTVQ